MRSIINDNLFRHVSASTDKLNSLCTIIHKLKSEGIYRGEVYLKEQFLGNFKINYNSKTQTSQINIDTSLFDPTYKTPRTQLSLSGPLEVGIDGYVVFHVSGHHNGIYIRIRKVTEKKEEDYFDSRKLGKGDMAVFRVIYPGEYFIQNTTKSQTFQFTVKEEKEGKYPHPSKLQPLTIVLTEKNFESKKAEVYPLQAILIKAETDCLLKLEYQKSNKDRKKVK